MVSNNITMFFDRPFSFPNTVIYNEKYIQCQFSSQCDLCAFVVGQFLGQCGLKG